MSQRMTVEHDLSAVWERMVRAGLIRNRFSCADGRQVEVGIRMAHGDPKYYALDIQTGEQFPWSVLERPLEGSDLILQWNPYRSLKPQSPTVASSRKRTYSPEVGDCLFSCQDPSQSLSLLQRYCPVKTTLDNFQWAALPNALPVEEKGHYLWVPVSTAGAITSYPHLLQVLTLPLLEDFLVLASSSANALTYFNSLHAGASVNHIHFQCLYSATAPAITRASARCEGGHNFLRDYAASGLVYEHGTGAEKIWKDLDRLQLAGIPLNLIHAGGRTFLLARDSRHEHLDEFPDAVLAGMELAGKAITAQKDFFEQASAATIEMALRKSTLSNAQLLSLLASDSVP